MFYRCSHVHLSKCILIKVSLKKQSGRFNPIAYGVSNTIPELPYFFSVRAVTLIFSDFYFYTLTRFFGRLVSAV